MSENGSAVDALFADIRSLVHSARRQAVQAINVSMVALYWQIGERIKREVLDDKRAAYGKKILATLSQELTAEFGPGYTTGALTRMIAFAEQYPDPKIVATLSQQLSWSHFVEIVVIDDALRRDFYTELCRTEGWSVRELRAKIKGMLFERTAISRKPEGLIRRELAALRDTGKMGTDLVFRDPYVLDFLGLTDTFSENDLERAILKELERFLLELGTDFTFVARQKRMLIGKDSFYLDLLFYHRRLRRLVAVELKLGRFTAAYKGQMELYLRWLDKHERREGEESPLGLILCSEKDQEQIELLQLDGGDVRVAEYITMTIGPDVLRAKLHKAIEIAQESIDRLDNGRGEICHE
ncbi:MAG: YhcG family protein [Negativicutes bacterium]